MFISTTPLLLFERIEVLLGYGGLYKGENMYKGEKHRKPPDF